MKTVLTIRRYIQPALGDLREYPSSTVSGGGVVKYKTKVEGPPLFGMDAEGTDILIYSVITSLNMQTVTGKQTPETVRQTLALRLPYLRVLLTLVDMDIETYRLLMPNDDRSAADLRRLYDILPVEGPLYPDHDDN